MKVGDLVVSTSTENRRIAKPRLVVELHATAKALVGVLFENEIKYVHYKHLEVVSASR